ncbi:MAG: hypothetical protein GYA57_13235 [Myxococcales bacterium]|nr:hypothetical protein [Myxococcales bacterium]
MTAEGRTATGEGGQGDTTSPAAAAERPGRALDLLVTVLVCLAVLAGLDVAFRTSALRGALDRENHYRLRPIEYAKLERPPDVVFIGDSRTLHALDPAAAEEALAEAGLSLSAYNLGLSGAPPMAQLALAGLALSRRPPPRVVLLFVSPYMVSTRIEPTLSRESLHTLYAWRDLPWMVAAGARVEDILDVFTSNLFRALAYRGRLVRLVFERQWPGPPAVMGEKGFQALGRVPPGVQAERARSRANGYRTELSRPAAAVGGEMLGYLDAALRRLREAGVAVAVVNTTSASALLEIYGPDSIYDEYLARVRAVCAARGVPFHDHLRNPVTTDADFTDGDHMNRDGARKYTRFVVREVVLPLLGVEPRPAR